MEVNVTKRIETQSGSRYCPVVVNSSGRIKSDWVIVNGNRKGIPKGPTTSNGGRKDNVSASQSARTPSLPLTVRYGRSKNWKPGLRVWKYNSPKMTRTAHSFVP